jgi:four helix bundle protein
MEIGDLIRGLEICRGISRVSGYSTIGTQCARRRGMNQQAEALKARTAAFATLVIDLCSSVPQTQAGRHITGQLIEAATSVNSNYRAACRGRSRAEFISKLGIATEEADECCGWLELLVRNRLLTTVQAADALREANELTAILTASQKTARQNHRRGTASPKP